MGDFWGTNAATGSLTLACVGLSLFLLTGLAVVSVCYLRPQAGRLGWSVAAVEAGLLVFGLAWYAVMGTH